MALWPNDKPVPVLAEDYDRAAELLDIFGWAQLQSVTSEGATCMGLAIVRAVAERRGIKTKLSSGIIEWEQVYRDTGLHYSVAHWNDTPGRTKEEVQEKLRSTAANRREREAVA